MTAPGLLEAFDQTIAAVRRLEAEGLRTAKGASAVDACLIRAGCSAIWGETG